MCFVDTGVDRLESGFGFRAFYMATDAVFAFSEGDDLAEVEYWLVSAFPPTRILNCLRQEGHSNTRVRPGVYSESSNNMGSSHFGQRIFFMGL